MTSLASQPVFRYPGRRVGHADLELVRRAHAGDPEAVREVAARIDRVGRACARNLAARSPAVRTHEEDLVQRLHVMLLENDRRALASYEGRASLETWIRVVGMRFFLRQAGRLPKERPTDEIADQPDPTEALEETQERKSTAAAVQKALEDLDSDDRLLLAMVFEQELTAKEVGVMLGLTASGVRMKKQRLLQRLEKRLRSLA